MVEAQQNSESREEWLERSRCSAFAKIDALSTERDALAARLAEAEASNGELRFLLNEASAGDADIQLAFEERDTLRTQLASAEAKLAVERGCGECWKGEPCGSDCHMHDVRPADSAPAVQTSCPPMCPQCDGRGAITYRANDGTEEGHLEQEPCPSCQGTGTVDAPTSADDPSCPDCDGEGRRSLRGGRPMTLREIMDAEDGAPAVSTNSPEVSSGLVVTDSAPAGYDRRDICYCGGCAHTRIPSCPPRAPDSAPAAPNPDEIVDAQHDETGRMWRGPRGLIPRRYYEVSASVCADCGEPMDVTDHDIRLCWKCQA